MTDISYANQVNDGCNTAMDEITNAKDVKHEYKAKFKK